MKIASIGLSLLLLAGLFSCNKEDFNYAEGTVGRSKVVNFPLISIKGTKILAIQQGNAYTDPGATATINGATVTYRTSTTITSSTAPGIYPITYTATNSDGFSATDFRIVVVVSNTIWNNADANANDFSGVYLRAATGVTSTWTKLAPGTYAVENPGGASVGAGFSVIVQNASGTSIRMPVQSSPFFGATISGSSETYSPGPPAQVTWVFNDPPAYGTSVRIFVKQ